MSAAPGTTARRILVPLLVLGGLLGGVHVLREATQSRHHATSPDSRLRVVVAPKSNRSEASQDTAEVVEAHLSFCHLEVGSEIEGEMALVSIDPLRYAVVMAPALDSTDRKQFRGCLEDWMVDNHLVDVISMEEYRVP